MFKVYFLTDQRRFWEMSILMPQRDGCDEFVTRQAQSQFETPVFLHFTLLYDRFFPRCLSRYPSAPGH
jgi:hypothetical protein